MLIYQQLETLTNGVITVDRTVYIRIQYFTDASPRVIPSVFKHYQMV